MTRGGRSHLLVEYQFGVEVQEREIEDCMKTVNRALEAVEFVQEECKWLKRERGRLAEEIDRRIEEYVRQILSYGVRQKQELDWILMQSIISLETFKTSEKCEYVLDIKLQGKHLTSMTAKFNELQTEELIILQGYSRKYQLATTTGCTWGFNGAVDALSFKASKRVELTGISLCKGKRERGLMLHSLEILHGNTTTSEVIYSHPEQRYMDSYHPFLVRICFKKAVSIFPHQYYTVKVQMLGCSGLSSSRLKSNEQDGLVVTSSKAVFDGSQPSNGSDLSCGVFYELHYFLGKEQGFKRFSSFRYK